MKKLHLLVVICLYFISCKKETDPDIDYCAEAINEFKGYTEFEGLIFFCNAQPPLMAFIPGVATTTFLDSNTFQVHLRADSINFDTILFYKYHCSIAEEIYPNISFDGQTIHDNGYFIHADFREDYTGSLDFSFGYPNCLNNSGFEGLGK